MYIRHVAGGPAATKRMNDNVAFFARGDTQKATAHYSNNLNGTRARSLTVIKSSAMPNSRYGAVFAPSCQPCMSLYIEAAESSAGASHRVG